MPNLVINIIGDARSLERALRKSERDTRTFSSRIGRAAKVTGVAAGAALGTGIAVGLQRSVDAAIEAQKVLGQTRVAVRNAGQSWGAFQGQIEASTKALSNLAAVDDEDLLTSFSTLVRVTGDVNRALELNATVADLARARNMDLQSAALLVSKVAGGNTSILRRYGIQVDKNASSVQALEMLHRRFAGSAAAYGRSAAGAQERFNVALQNMEEAIGTALLPTLTIYLNQASAWLNNSKNQKRIADDLTSIIGGLAAAVEGLATAYEHASDWARKFNDQVKRFSLDYSLRDLVKDLGNFGGAPLKIPGGDFGGGGDFPVAGAAGARGGRYGIRFPGTHAGPKARTGGAAQIGMSPQRRAEIRNNIFDNMVARLLGRVEDASSLRVQIGKLRTIAGLIQQQIGVTKDVARRVNLQDQILDIQAQIVGKQQQKADEAKAARAAALDERLGWLQFAAERAESTKTLTDDLKVQRRIEKYWKERLRHEGRTLEIVSELWRTQQKINDLNKKGTDAEIAATRFVRRDPAKLAAMLGLGGNQYATAMLAAYGRGGTLPSRGGQFAGTGVYVANQHIYGITDVNQFENAMTKQGRGKAHNRRGAR